MTHDDITRMAREAGAGEPESLFGRTDYIVMTRHELERFATLVAAAEREKFCAVLRQLHDSYSLQSNPTALRARGEK